MIRTLPILAALPTLAACDIENIINPGKASREAWEYRQAGLIQTPITPQPTQVAEIPVPAAVDVPEPVYVAPEPPAPYVPHPPTCMPVYKIVACGPNGETILLET